MTNVSEQAGRSRRITIAVLVGTAILAGTAVALLAVTLLGRPEGQAAGTDQSLKPSESAMSTTSATATSAAMATADPTPHSSAPTLASGTIAVVRVNDLNVRDRPALDARSFGHLSAGTRVFVAQGPEQAGGYGWYRIATVDWGNESAPCAGECPRSGWVAGTTEANETWLSPEELACPPEPNLKAFARLNPFERLACYGDQPLTLKGAIWQPCCGYVGAMVYEPNWLSWPSGPPSLSYTETLSYSGVLLRFDPDTRLEEPAYADIVRVTGHMDDPAAATCTVRVDESALYEDPTLTADPEELAYAPLGCRTQFVVDSIEILGNTGETCRC